MEENISKISSQTQKTTLSSDENAQIQPATRDSDTAKPTCVNEANSTLTDKKGEARSRDERTYDNTTPNSMNNSSKLLTRSELITFFRTLHTGPKVSLGMTTIGLVGYPNVGKSSTINTLLMDKKVHILEDRYGIMLPAPLEGEDPLRPPTAEELLNAYGCKEPSYVKRVMQLPKGANQKHKREKMGFPSISKYRSSSCSILQMFVTDNRGFMTQNGQPDNPRSARYILKDFVNGKLLYCHGTPGCDQSQYHVYPERNTDNQPRELPPAAKRFNKSHKLTTEDLDKAFFHKTVHSVHQKGMTVLGTRSGISNDGSMTGSTMSLAQQSKPWKNHKDKRNKKEKLRRVYSHLDIQ
uniref:Large subunit GTPase 1 homolog n=1 Tax=Timema bartmani TaxID=61472 RepID=A0A7R9EUV0_9NEOP|nr:unnamed protein product [Timema bartmani]